MPTFTVANDASFSRQILLDPEDERHLLRVLRTRPGEVLQVINGSGQIARVKIASLNPLRFELMDVRDGEKPLPLAMHLPLIDQDRLEWAAEKLTELNVAEIRLVATARTQTRELKPAKFERLKKSVITAQKQCGRTFPVIVSEPSPIESLSLRPDALKFVASLHGNAPSAEWLSACAQAPWVEAFVGPEGGFTEEEEARLTRSGAMKIGFGTTVQRTETAALSLAAMMNLAVGMRR